MMRWLHLLIFYLYFLYANDGVTENPIIRLLPVFCTFLCIILIKFNFNLIIFKKLAPVHLLVFFLLVGIYRSNSTHISILSNLFRLTYILSFIIQILIFLFSKRNKTTLYILKYMLFYPLLLYVITNYLYYIGVFQSHLFLIENIGEAILLKNIFGLNMNRAVFPLMGGIVNFAFLVGIIFIYFLYQFFNKHFTLINLFGIGLTSYILLINDSRVVIFTAFFVIVFQKYLFRRYVPVGITFLVLAGPILFVGVLQLFVFLGLDELIGRSSTDVVTGNSRLFIWVICLNEIIDFKLSHILGFGEFGAFKLGLSQEWASLFNKFDSSEFISPHNNAITLFFDSGYIGLIVFTYNIYLCFRENINNIFSKDECSFSKIVVLLLTFFCFTSITDVPYGSYTMQNTFIIIIIFYTSRFRNVIS